MSKLTKCAKKVHGGGDSNLHPSRWQLSLLHAHLSSFLLVPTSFEELVLLAAGPGALRACAELV